MFLRSCHLSCPSFSPLLFFHKSAYSVGDILWQQRHGWAGRAPLCVWRRKIRAVVKWMTNLATVELTQLCRWFFPLSPPLSLPIPLPPSAGEIVGIREAAWLRMVAPMDDKLRRAGLRWRSDMAHREAWGSTAPSSIVHAISSVWALHTTSLYPIFILLYLWLWIFDLGSVCRDVNFVYPVFSWFRITYIYVLLCWIS